LLSLISPTLPLFPYLSSVSVDELKEMLASATHVAIEDQILLIGPPYKPLKRLDPPLVFSSSSATDEEAAQAEQQQQQQHLSYSTSTLADSSSSSITASLSSSSPSHPSIRSIYLYNRRSLDAPSIPLSSSSSSSTDPTRTPLPILLSELPLTPPHPPPAWLEQLLNQVAGGGPLSQALSQYERLVSLNLAKGHTYVHRAQALVEAAVRCLEEQRIQRDAGQVASTNLGDHFLAIARDARELRRKYGKQAEGHESLLGNFNDNLRELEKWPLHPALGRALVEAVREGGGGGFGGDRGETGGALATPSLSPLGGSGSSSSSSGSSSGRGSSLLMAGLECEAIRKATVAAESTSSPPSSCRSSSSSWSSSLALDVTLLDCVPVGRVKDWFRECRITRDRLSRWMDEVDESFKRLEEGVEAQRGREGGRTEWGVEEGVDRGRVTHGGVEALTRQATEQEKAVALLERGHKEMLDRIRMSFGGGREEGGEGEGGPSSVPPSAKVVGTCQWLEGVLTRQAGVMAALEGIDHDMTSHVKELVQQKQLTGEWLRSRLAVISRLQGDIQTLRQNLSIGREGGRGRAGDRERSDVVTAHLHSRGVIHLPSPRPSILPFYLGNQAMHSERRNFLHLEHLEKLPSAYTGRSCPPSLPLSLPPSPLHPSLLSFSCPESNFLSLILLLLCSRK